MKQHPAETLVEWSAPALLGGAAGWAAWTVGFSAVIAAASAAVLLCIGLVAMRQLGAAREPRLPPFEPAAFETSEVPMTEDELLLDDPLTEVPSDSRVVQLFARSESTPGELLLRIEDYLGDGRRAPAPPEATGEAPRPADASAALHAALANIRASLR